MAPRVPWSLSNEVSLAPGRSFLPTERYSLVTEMELALVWGSTVHLLCGLRTRRFGFETGRGGNELGAYKQVTRFEASNSFPDKCGYPLDVLQ